MNAIDIAFRDYWNGAQPLIAIQHKSGITLADAGVVREIRRQVEEAYRAGWNDCGKRVATLIKEVP
jgi:hypothetical protein